MAFIHLAGPILNASRSITHAARLAACTHSLAVEAHMCSSTSTNATNSSSSNSINRGPGEASTSSISRECSVGWLSRAVKQKGNESFKDMLERKHKAWYAKLTKWEKAYLAAGAAGGGIYVYATVDWDGSKAAAEEAKRAKEAQLYEDRLKTLPAYLQGKSFIGEEDSPLEGASPAEIEALAETARRSMPAPHLAFSSQWAKAALEEDPYEGLSPEEIDALVERQGGGR